MSQTWFIFSVLTVMALQLCKGEKPCIIKSSNGTVVQQNSSFRVSCIFTLTCKHLVLCDHPPQRHTHKDFNSTTIYFDVVNIQKNRTFSCVCEGTTHDPCGIDISAGYPPDRPDNISCVYKVTHPQGGVVICSWNSGRDTYLWNTANLWVRTVSGNHTEPPKSSKGTDSQSTTFHVSRSVQSISVWVSTENKLASAVSDTVNYTLSDIAMPSAPVLSQAHCSSRHCDITVTQPVWTQHLEIQYRTGQEDWTTFPDTSGQQVRPITSLEPYRLYQFQARSRFSNGYWSEWSTQISNWTQEEAPAKELDVWLTEPNTELNSVRVYWKEANISIARGRIVQYIIRVSGQSSVLASINVSADVRNYSVPFCGNCEVTVYSSNSKGLSPPAKITAPHTKAELPGDVKVKADNHNVTISWRKPRTAPLPAAYVVEWHPEGRKLEELQWLRLGGNEDHAVVTDMKPFMCYKGAVYIFYNESSVNRRDFKGVSTMESTPTAGPFVKEKVEGNLVKVTWVELPQDQRMGCITHYTIYLENSDGHRKSYNTSDRMFIIADLSPAVYTIWMTASTGKGEGIKGQKVKFFIQQETQLSVLLVCGVTVLVLMVFLWLCQCSAVKQRFWVFFQCLMLEVVPDPANSKWAKECTKEKGMMDLQLPLSNHSMTEEEDEPTLSLLDVQEMPKMTSDTFTPTAVSPLLRPQTSLSPDTEPPSLPYPAYIKSFSQDSSSSEYTLTSADTNMTIDYIATHEPEIMDEEAQEEEEEEFVEMPGFFSRHIFEDPLVFGGKLTLDAVKIDCSEFFPNS